MISLNKKYKTLYGSYPAEIICIDLEPSRGYPVVARIKFPDDALRTYAYTERGYHDCDRNDHPLDLVEITEWDHIKEDDNVWVRQSETEPWERACFARVIGGQPAIWPNGRVSWTVGNANPVVYNYCSKA